MNTQTQTYTDKWQPHRDPNVPRSFAGTLVAVEMLTTQPTPGTYAQKLLFQLRADSGEPTSLLVVGTVLEGEVSKLRPEPGERLEIDYMGIKLRKGVVDGSPESTDVRNRFHVWRLRCPERPAADAYSSIYGAPEADEPARPVHAPSPADLADAAGDDYGDAPF
jgi:hypothetical protein